MKDAPEPGTLESGIEGEERGTRGGSYRSFEALLFDVDGTLAVTEELHRQAFNEAFRVHRLRWYWSPDSYSRLLQVTGGKERISRYIESMRFTPRETHRLSGMVSELHETKTRLYGRLLDLGRWRLRCGVRRLLEEARAAEVTLAIASTTSPRNVESLISASLGREALTWFSAIVTGDVVARKKPAPDIYRLALEQLGIPAGRAIAFEDSALGVRSAKGAGLFTVATPSAWTVGQDFSAADLVLTSIGDPDEPLGFADRCSLGGAVFLGLEQLAALHGSRIERTVGGALGDSGIAARMQKLL